MNIFLKAAAKLIPAGLGAPRSPMMPSQIYPMNNGITLYPYSNDNTFIRQGYNKNAFVYAIVSKCAKKFSQVPWYHYKLKRGTKSTWDEYQFLTKHHLQDPKARLEAKRIKIKAVDQVVVDDDLSKLLAKPNRNQSGSALREQLYGYKLLTGEGNLWFSRPTAGDGSIDQSKPPSELFIIPKDNLALVRGSGFNDIQGYALQLGGQTFPTPPENILSWKFPNYLFDPVNLSHLRGQSPLDAGLLTMQASNEAQERIAAINKNQGVAGLAFNRADTRPWTTDQAMFNRRQFNSIINDSDLAGTIAYMNGDWGFLQMGFDAQQLQLLEQSEVTKETLCNIFDVPPGIFAKDQTYENVKENERRWIYGNIAVAAYGLRDELNAKLIPEFQLDNTRDVIDCDISALPELSQDQKEVADFLNAMGPRLSLNEGREMLGWEISADPNMDKHYIATGQVPLEQANAVDNFGGSLDGEVNLLNNNQAT